MGKLIKNHWARLIIMTAAVCQFAAGLHCIFWPKIFFDMWTKNLDNAVKPIPILQVINMILGLIMFAWELPLNAIAGTAMHRSIAARLVVLPLFILPSILIYQGTNPALYYAVGMGVYLWAYSEGETVVAKPWSLPERPSRVAGKV